MDVTDRVRGVLLGLAAGDRNGGPTRLALRLSGSLAERRRVVIAGRPIAPPETGDDGTVGRLA